MELTPQQEKLLGNRSSNMSMERISLLMENANPKTRRRLLVDSLAFEQSLQHEESKLSKYFVDNEENVPPPLRKKESAQFSKPSATLGSTCSIDPASSKSSNSSSSFLSASERSTERSYTKSVSSSQDKISEGEQSGMLARHDNSPRQMFDCSADVENSPYRLNKYLVSPERKPSISKEKEEKEREEEEQEEEEDSVKHSEDVVGDDGSKPNSRRETLVRRKSRQVLQLFKKRRSARNSGREHVIEAESLRQEIQKMEKELNEMDKTIMSALRTENDRLEMRVKILRADLETRHTFADQLPKSSVLMIQQTRKPKEMKERTRCLEERILRQWCELPRDSLQLHCAGSRVRKYITEQIGMEISPKSDELASDVVLLCSLQWLSQADISCLKQTCRRWYNVCSLYTRAKPVSDLSVELYNSEAVYYSYLKTFLNDYRDVLVDQELISENESEEIFGAVDVVTKQSKIVLNLLEKALSTETPTQSAIPSIFIQSMNQFEQNYSHYCSSYPAARLAIENLLASKKVGDALGEASPLTLSSFSIMPVQRLPRYLLMLQSMLHKTSPKHGNYDDLKLATEVMQLCTSSINRHLQEAEEETQMKLVLSTIADAPEIDNTLERTKLISQKLVNISKPVMLLLLFNDRIMLATKNTKSSATASQPWRFRSEYELQNCHARAYDDPRESKIQILTEHDCFLVTFHSEEEASSWLTQFSATLSARLKYHPRPLKVEKKLQSPRTVLIRFAQMDGKVLIRPVSPKVNNISKRHSYVLETEEKIFLFIGSQASEMETIFAEHFVTCLVSDPNTVGNPSAEVVRLSEDAKNSEFFVLLGGNSSLLSSETLQISPPPGLEVIDDHVSAPKTMSFSFSSLPCDGCAIIDAKVGPIFVWAALHSSPGLRDRAIVYAQERYADRRSIEFVLAGCEPPLFRFMFLDWPGLKQFLPADTAAIQSKKSKKKTRTAKFFSVRAKRNN